MNSHDPLQNPLFKAPNIFEKLRGAFLGIGRPFSCVQIEVTSYCMGECIYCPHTTQAESWKSRHIKPEVFAAIWPLLRQSSRAHLQGWGEPFLHPRFFDFVKLAMKAGCDVSTTSCGLIMNEKLAYDIIESGMDIIAFSLVGVDAKSNDARKKVDFDKVCENIKFLRSAIIHKKKGPELHLAYLALSDRIDSILYLPQLMDKLDVDLAVISTLDYLAKPEHKSLAFSAEALDKLDKAKEVMQKASEEAEKRGRIIHFSLPDRDCVEHARGCRENIASTLYINAEGDISPCVYLNVPGNDPIQKRRYFGNVLQDDPLKVWQKPDYTAFRQALMDGRPEGPCLDCPKRRESEG